ncbi:hypothetical protein EJ04DRAFT_513234 [Polyplosphaeria fusca]|uniref:Uncharacterized protein n=1 Tax=Polyplosphaeria fusca TaxID=682080 RepID=A0A9P4QYP8_9PLEO|nr:hypothetical protein EJ04DRAFT_513234 [Polyplosphaeria fusca]
MLRPRPSEITLTPADIEETRRRMASRNRAPAQLRESRFPLPTYGPRLQPGPARSRDAAVTRLGNIPVLTPQVAVLASAESDSDDISPILTRRDSRTHTITDTTSPSPVALPPSTQNDLGTGGLFSTPNQALQLPFRPAHTAREAANSTASQENTDEESTPSPPKGRYGHSHTGPERGNTSEDRNQEGARDQAYPLTDGVADTLSSTRQSINQTTTPLHRNHERDAQDNSSNSRNLERRIATWTPRTNIRDLRVQPSRYRRTYQVLPHTEPRQRLQHTSPTIRLSSSHASLGQIGPHSSRNEQSSAEYDFWTARGTDNSDQARRRTTEFHSQDAHAEPLSRSQSTRNRTHNTSESFQSHYHDPSLRGRNSDIQAPSRRYAPRASERVSEASSNGSLPYSFYELPASRHPSGSPSQDSGIIQSQFDGASPSRQSSHGRYISIRPSQVQAALSGPMRPPPARVSSFSSPNLTSHLNAASLSPLPASPYSRAPSEQGSRPSGGLVTKNDFVGGDREATEAARRDLISPLDLLAQRASSYLTRIESALQVQSSRRSSRTHTASRHSTSEYDGSTLVGDGSSIRTFSGDSAPTRARTARQTRTTQTFDTRQQLSLRAQPGVRIGQPSSENAPVGALAPQGRSVAHPQGPPQRAIMAPVQTAGGTLRGMAIVLTVNDRHSPQVAPIRRSRSPRHVFSDTIQPSSPIHVSPPQSHSPGSRAGRLLNTIRPSRRPAPPIPTAADRQLPGRLSMQAPRARLSNPGFATQRNDDRDQIQHSIEPHLAGAARHRLRNSQRRMSLRQLNQENSGDVTDALMREELQTVGMRHGNEEQQLDVMDETPPPIGRYESHL